MEFAKTDKNDKINQIIIWNYNCIYKINVKCCSNSNLHKYTVPFYLGKGMQLSAVEEK